MVDGPIERIREIDSPTADAIKLYREERFTIIKGGRYLEIVFDLPEKKLKPVGLSLKKQR